MGQLMGNQRLPALTPRLIRSLPKEQILTRRKRLRLNGLIQLVRLGIRVNLHRAKICAKLRFKIGAQGVGKRLTPAPAVVQAALEVAIRLKSTFTDPLDEGLHPQLILTLHWRGHAAHRLRHPVSLLLIPVRHRPDLQLWLDDGAAPGLGNHPLHVAIAVPALQLEQGLAGSSGSTAGRPLQGGRLESGQGGTGRPRRQGSQRTLSRLTPGERGCFELGLRAMSGIRLPPEHRLGCGCGLLAVQLFCHERFSSYKMKNDDFFCIHG
jgi:hypothetical protein